MEILDEQWQNVFREHPIEFRKRLNANKIGVPEAVVAISQQFDPFVQRLQECGQVHPINIVESRSGSGAISMNSKRRRSAVSSSAMDRSALFMVP